MFYCRGSSPGGVNETVWFPTPPRHTTLRTPATTTKERRVY